MKRTVLPFALIIFSVTMSAGVPAIDPESFGTPPKNSHIATWWHWMDGRLTKEGITKDLEAMKAQNIDDATILNVYRDIGVTGVPLSPFGTDDWFGMFRHALEEADRLGMTIGAANCDGWSEAGGPWITPETSMKQYTWRKTYLKGNGREQSISLAQPFGRERFYRDAFVVAYRAAVPNSFVEAAPKASCNGRYPNETLTKTYSYQDWEVHIDEEDVFPAERLIDGDPFTGLTLNSSDRNILLEFKKPFLSDRLNIYIYKSAATLPIPVVVETSTDGKVFSPVDTVYVTETHSLQSLPFRRSKALFYRLIVNEEGAATTLGEVELLYGDERGQFDGGISNFPMKAVFVGAKNSSVPYTTNTGEALTTEVIDLSDKMDSSGVLHWAAPKGDWTIIRFGYTSNAKCNHPASPEGIGLECDKMDTTALNLHFESFPKKLIETAGEYTGNTFKYLLIDSWEAGQQNWTENFADEFAKRRGYSLVPYIPALCGEVVGSGEETNAFLHDFRKTIGDLIEDYFFRHFAALCHRNGLLLYSEGIYGSSVAPPCDVLSTYKYCDVPMSEFWTRIGGRDYPYTHIPSNYTGHSVPFHASLIYDKPVIGAEAYTGMAFYSESPIDLKLYGDQIVSEGVNHFILHSYVHQPDDRKPGVTLGIYGNTFNRNNTWFPYVGSFFESLARQQYILQKGDRCADALIFLGDKLPSYEAGESYLSSKLPQNIKFNYINKEVLLERLSVRDGKILLDESSPFQFLMLRDREMDIETARKVESLVLAGAVVYAEKPRKTLSLTDYKEHNEELLSIANRVWGEGNDTDGEHRYGKGKVVWNKRSLLDTYQADVKVNGISINDILYLHKTIEDKEVYYLVNKNNTSSVSFEAAFRVGDELAPSLWNPQDGSVEDLAVYSFENGGYVCLPLTLNPRQTVFVVFDRTGAEKDHIVSVRSEYGYSLFPVERVEDICALPKFTFTGNKNDIEVFSSSSAFGGEVVFKSGRKEHLNCSSPKSISIDGTIGTMTFVGQEEDLGTMPIGGFKRLNTSRNTLIRYYSGEVCYKTKMFIPEDFLSSSKVLLMSVPEFGSTAAIEINGVPVRTLWDPYDKVDITELVRAGENDLTVRVTNPWRNRLIGDKVESRGSKDLWTTSPLLQKSNPSYPIITKDATLMPSGIAKPIIVYCIQKETVKK